MNAKIDELKWVRAFSPDIIPRYLVEQIKHKDYSIDDFYKYQNLNCLMESRNGHILNPFNHLYVLADKENIVKGFLWFVVDALSKDVIINIFSMDKEYWNNGEAVKKLADHVKEFLEKMKLKKVYWITNYPKHSERHGFKQSKSVLMEYNLDKETQEKKEANSGKITRGGDCPSRRYQHADSGTAAAVK